MLVPVDNSDRGCVIVATVRAMKKSTDPHLGVDANGCLTERVTFGSETIVLHHDDIPESDITLVGGVPCTTAIRTVIDIAAELRPAELETVMNDCLDRGLFTIDEMRSHSATGLIKFGQRWFSATTGTWTQQDTLDAPLDFANANRYAYAGDDPINAQDPSGTSTLGCVAGIIGLGGSAVAFIASLIAEFPTVGLATAAVVGTGLLTISAAGIVADQCL